MPLEFHDSLSGTKRAFEPATPGQVSIYNCGPTVYNYNHLGNFRAYVFVDLLRRHLKFRGYKVRQTTNITDVDDKIVNAAVKNGVPIGDLTAPYITAYLEDLEYLGIDSVEERPRATDYIPAMLEMIRELEKSGHVYEQDGNVYFRLSSFEKYGKLSNLAPDQLRTAADGRFAADEYDKEDVRDFALWKAPGNADEQSWDSPYGAGRPGWHLECSAMIRAIYGKAGVDIHTGGIDLLFPHHENEIAQSCCAHPGDRFVGLWLHNEHLLVDGQKMAKSAGNFFMLRDFSDRERLAGLIRNQGAPESLLKLYDRGMLRRCLRYVLLSTHYRQKLNFSFTAIAGAESSIKRLQNTIDRLRSGSRWAGESDAQKIESELANLANSAQGQQSASPGGAPVANAGSPGAVQKARTAFTDALDDDLNIARALAALFDFCRECNELVPANPTNSTGGTTDTAFADAALIFFAEANSVLGFLSFAPEAANGSSDVDADTAASIEARIVARREARANKDFAEADRIRDELLAEGIVLKDGADGTTWSRA